MCSLNAQEWWGLARKHGCHGDTFEGVLFMLAARAMHRASYEAIGELAKRYLSYQGFIPQPDLGGGWVEAR